MNPIKEIRRSLAKRGVVGTVRFTVVKSIEVLRNRSLSRRRVIDHQRKSDLEFDSKYGVDTAGTISIGDLNVSSQNYVYGVRYQPIHEVDFAEVLEEFNLSYEQFTFVDFGAGKGRAIILAAALPFKKIIGVEFSDQLCSVAEENLTRLRQEQKACKDISLVHMDVAEFDLPREDFLILFLYNPFGRPVMEQVASNVAAWYEEKPRRVIVLYFQPEHSDVWDSIAFLEKKRETRGLCIYESEPAARIGSSAGVLPPS